MIRIRGGVQRIELAPKKTKNSKIKYLLLKRVETNNVLERYTINCETLQLALQIRGRV